MVVAAGRPTGRHQEQGQVARATILLVDDEAIVLDVVERYLLRDGYGVRVARDGETALELARSERPDLIVLDVMLPGLNGLEVAQRLRAESAVPIIMLSARGEETDKQLYRFQDHGERWVGLRFDLTVPLARFAAQHVAQLGTPFKRYHIAPVWRGENTQRGRFREFMQCDFDTIGTRSIAADIETTLVIHDLFQALGISDFTIHVNNRLVLAGLLEKLGLVDRTTAVLRALETAHERCFIANSLTSEITIDATVTETVTAVVTETVIER